jgi:hypothetical protein
MVYGILNSDILKFTTFRRRDLTPEDGGRSLLRNVVNFRVLYICILHIMSHFIHIKDDGQSQRSKWFRINRHMLCSVRGYRIHYSLLWLTALSVGH